MRSDALNYNFNPTTLTLKHKTSNDRCKRIKTSLIPPSSHTTALDWFLRRRTSVLVLCYYLQMDKIS